MYGPLVGMNNLQPAEENGKAGPVQYCHVCRLLVGRNENRGIYVGSRVSNMEF